VGRKHGPPLRCWPVSGAARGAAGVGNVAYGKRPLQIKDHALAHGVVVRLKVIDRLGHGGGDRSRRLFSPPQPILARCTIRPGVLAAVAASRVSSRRTGWRATGSVGVVTPASAAASMAASSMSPPPVVGVRCDVGRRRRWGGVGGVPLPVRFAAPPVCLSHAVCSVGCRLPCPRPALRWVVGRQVFGVVGVGVVVVGGGGEWMPCPSSNNMPCPSSNNSAVRQTAPQTRRRRKCRGSLQRQRQRQRTSGGRGSLQRQTQRQPSEAEAAAEDKRRTKAEVKGGGRGGRRRTGQEDEAAD